MNRENRGINIRNLVVMALLVAITCVSTMLIRIPTPGFGYIHPGDGFVLLCGFLLGPVAGPLCAGVGSALADLFAGYLIYVPGTFVIKALCALLAWFVFSRFISRNVSLSHNIPGIITGGILGELLMVAGYFLYESLLLSGSVGYLAALASVPFNLVQGGFGVIVASILCPIISPLYSRAVTR